MNEPALLPVEKCACGRSLHYLNPTTYRRVKQESAEFGETVSIKVGEQTYSVQRHYLALHGVKARDLPALAKAGIVTRVA